MSTSGEVGRIRKALEVADDHEKNRRAAKSARLKIRLGSKPVMRKGLFGFLQRPNGGQDQWFSEAETHVIYEALEMLAQEHADKAREAEESAVKS